MSLLPEHLVPIEIERELLAGLFRASALADELVPGAQATVDAMAELSPDDMAIREHRQILATAQQVLAEAGAVSPALVRDELRQQGRYDALRLLPSLIAYAWAPFIAVPTLIKRVQEASAGRKRWQGLLIEQAELLAGEVA